MARIKILITVKTYPTLSSKYDELVCTAGFREDGTWIRIYPVPFRKLDYDRQYSKYDWIEIDVVKKTSDFRPESFQPKSIEDEFKIVGHIGTEHNWALRKEIILKNVYTNLTNLINEAKDKKICTSLAVFKPTKIMDFTVEAVERVWDEKKLRALEANAQQFKLFEKSENPFKVVNKLPYKFSYKFTDDAGRESKLMIEDWEIGALYWRQLEKHHGNEKLTCEDVRAKYFDDFAKTKDLYLFLGTTFEYHLKNAPNPFVIIGTFTPKIETQYSLF